MKPTIFFAMNGSYRVQTPEAGDLPAAATDLSPAMLAVQVYGCASRTDLGALATESHRLRGSSSLTR
jgi:hypothetical protein